MTTTALNVAAYIYSLRPNDGEMAIHKKVYYAQAWHLAWSGQPLFSDAIEAWKDGPVIRSVRNMYPHFPEPDLTPEQMAAVDAVMAHYGNMNGSELSILTHNEDPWIAARGGASKGERSDAQISPTSMAHFYGSLIGVEEPDTIPYIPVDCVEATDDDRVSDVIKDVVAAWPRTIAALAK